MLDELFNGICHSFQSDTGIVLGDRRDDLFQIFLFVEIIVFIME